MKFHYSTNHPRGQRACQTILFCSQQSSMWHCNDRRAKPAGFCLTEKSLAELAGLVVNNKSLPCQLPTAGTYHQAAESTLFLWPLVRFHSNSLMKMSHPQMCVLVANSSATEYESSCPVSLNRARLAVNQSDADAVETVLWTGTQYSFHFPGDGRQG